VGVQKVRWDEGSTEPAGEYTFFLWKENGNHELGTGFSCIRVSYQQLRGLSSLVIGVIHINKRPLVQYNCSEMFMPQLKVKLMI
jgi:hypothetical protein